MGHEVEYKCISVHTDNVWLQDAFSRFDVVAELSAALPPDWTVEREVDPVGDISIIAFPICNDLGSSAFVVYEDDGFVQVGTISGETWGGRRTFPTCRSAVAAIVAAAHGPLLRWSHDSPARDAPLALRQRG
jgi:hypothetical protein